MNQDKTQTDWLWFEQYNFSKGRQVFMAGIFRAAYELFLNMEDEYTIVPVPKYDEYQEEYLTHLNDRYTIWGVPINAEDTEFVGTVTNALAKESYGNVYSEFYDVVLKTRFSKDPDCSRMVDLIMSGVRFDVAYMFSDYMADAPYIFRNLIKSNSTDLSSNYKEIESSMHTKMENLKTFYS